MNRRWMNIAIGLFVALALILLGTMIVLFNNLPRLFKQSNYYTAHFASAPGLSAGAPVRRSGVLVGEVAEVKLDDEVGEVRVRLAIDKPYLVRHNEQVTLVQTVLGGDTAIDLAVIPPPEGKPVDRTPYPPESDLAGVESVSVAALLKGASEVVPTTQETLNDMRKSLKKLEELSPVMEGTLKEYRKLGESINASIPDLRETNLEIQKLAKTSREAVGPLQRDAEDMAAAARSWTKVGERVNLMLSDNREKIDQAIENANQVLSRLSGLLSDENQRNFNAILRNVRDGSDPLPEMSRNANELLKDTRVTLKRFNETLTQVDGAANDLRKITKPFADRGDATARNLDESLDKLNRTLGDVQALVRAIGQGDGTLKRLISDPALYNHLDEAACQAAKLVPKFDQVVHDIEVFTDKLARHPELIGVGGAIRGSNGLKDPPTPPGAVVPPRPSGQ
jgi:phospholipid/cholesterol/gamma-HCH transport system substrate-binding protein